MNGQLQDLKWAGECEGTLAKIKRSVRLFRGEMWGLGAKVNRRSVDSLGSKLIRKPTMYYPIYK